MKQFKKILVIVIVILVILVIMYHFLNRQEEALVNFQASIECYRQENEFGPLAESYYNAACVACVLHLAEETIEYLEKSVEINPKYRKIALSDEDFRSIRSSQPFKNIVE